MNPDNTIKHIFLALFAFICIHSCKTETYYTIATASSPAEGGIVACSAPGPSVLEGTQVIFTATPRDEYVFTDWSGSLSGTENPKTMTVSSDMTVTANFMLKDYTLTLSVEGEGRIDEKVISTKTDYSFGTVVELTAVPGSGWSFGHWEGDISSADNPAQITVSSEKYVKAVFTRNYYSYNLSIIGPGVVDEYLVEDTKATLGHGTKVLLKAVPSKGALFKGWSGGMTGNEMEVVVNIDEIKDIVAEFVADEEYYKRLPIDLYQPSSMTKRLYYGLDFSSISYFPTGFIAVDYDQDGYVDAISCHGDYSNNGRLPMVFYKGPYFTHDVANNEKYLSPLGIRKSFVGDFNGDGKPDICFVGHGNEYFPDPKDYPIFLMSTGAGTFDRVGIEECFAYYHGSCAGDFDNDGDLDVILLDEYHSKVLVNDGHGNFTVKDNLLNGDMLVCMCTCELYDLNHDGYLDLVVGGHEHEGKEWHKYSNTTCVFWGNGQTFNHDNYDRCPRFRDGYGITLDYLFYDLDGDGQEEIINIRTGDGLALPSYQGWAIQIVSYNGTSFTDVTFSYIDDAESGETGGISVTWIDMEEIAGEVFLCGRKETNAECLYSFKNGKLVRVRNEMYPAVTSGFPILIEKRTMHHGWQQYASFVIDFQDGLDLSALVAQDYCLELYIQNTDPTLTFDYHFDLFSVLSPDGDNRVYGTGTDMRSMKNDGSWERLCIPLKQFDGWGEGPTENYWNKVDQFVLITTSHGGTEFSVKDIRIRKCLEE